MTQLLSSLVEKKPTSNASRQCHLVFYHSPLEMVANRSGQVSSVIFGVNRLDENENAISTAERKTLQTGLVLKSLGYKSIAIDPSIPMDSRKGTIANIQGKVLDIDYFNLPNEEKDKTPPHFAEGLYCSGWAATGATGVIVGTMGAAFETASHILADLESRKLDERPGSQLVLKLLQERNVKVVSFSDWQKIDQFEKQLGEKIGKPREKLVNEHEMLDVVNKSQ